MGERKRKKRVKRAKERRGRGGDGYPRVVLIPTYTLYYNISYMRGVPERALVFAGISKKGKRRPLESNPNPNPNPNPSCPIGRWGAGGLAWGRRGSARAVAEEANDGITGGDGMAEPCRQVYHK